MKTHALAVAAAVVFASTGFALAASNEPPGQAMHENGAKSTAPGASEYAPGHIKKEKGDTDASKYAPGHSTTGSATERRDRDDNSTKSDKR